MSDFILTILVAIIVVGTIYSLVTNKATNNFDDDLPL